ncbi:amino acid adenylation domain-containing protein [Nocardia sp. NPDC056952]|uniref:non-ribosomal peptide synthetase family protein n=1 Tax=Nocardia sp. NPDC056952 TaxID=3345979 RepID=UPI003640CFFF
MSESRDFAYRAAIETEVGLIHRSATRPTEVITARTICKEPFDEARFTTAVRTAVTLTPLSDDFDLIETGQLRRRRTTNPALDIRVADQRASTPGPSENEIAADVSAATAEAFDLGAAPLTRFLVHVLNSAEFQITVIVHPALLGQAAVCSAISLLIDCYMAPFTTSLPPAFRAVTPEQPSEQTIRRWVDQFDGADASPLRFWSVSPVSADDPPGTEFRRPHVLTPSVSAGLRRVAADRGVSLTAVLLAVHVRAVIDVTGRHDIVVGVEVPGAAEPAAMPDNTVPVRVRHGRGSWNELVSHLSSELDRAHTSGTLSIQRLHRELGVDQLLTSTTAHRAISVDDPRASIQISAPFDGAVLVEWIDDARSGELSMQFVGDGLAPGQLWQLMRLHESHAIDCATDPTQMATSQMPVEHRFLLDSWSRSETKPRPYATVHAMIRAQAQRTPERIAVQDSKKQITYRELDAISDRIASSLRRIGVQRGSIVAVCGCRDADLVPIYLGAMKAGAAYLPLDPAQPADRLRQTLYIAEVDVLITDRVRTQALSAGPWRIVPAEELVRPHTPHDDLGWPPTGADDLMYVMYTSGSTGTPKGVEVPHRGVVNYLYWCIETYLDGMGQGAPAFSSVAFDMGVTNMYVPLVTGQRTWVIEDDVDIYDTASRLAELPTFAFIKMTPGHLAVLTALLDETASAALTRTLVLGGDAFSIQALRSWRRKDPQTPLLNEYGPTETSIANSVHVVTGTENTDILPIGVPIPNTSMFVLDPALRPVPIGVPGELYIGGDCVVRGYLKRPGLTSTRFVADPFADRPGQRMYRTGDMCRWLPSGTAEFLGRTDDQIKIRGYRIEPSEVEAALTSHSGVSAAAVTVVGEDPLNLALAAYFVADSGPLPTGTLRNYLAQRLPEYLVPTFLVQTSSIPLTANGKVDKRALPPAAKRRAARPSNLPADRVARHVWHSIIGASRPGETDPIPAADRLACDVRLAAALAQSTGLSFAESLRIIARCGTFGELRDEVEKCLPPFPAEVDKDKSPSRDRHDKN